MRRWSALGNVGGERLVAPPLVLRKVSPPRRKKNAELRTREYLTPAEVEALYAATKANRYPHRDTTMILTAYRHGLRVSELIDLRWDQIDFDRATLHVRRSKRGSAAIHPIMGDELRAVRRLQREQDPKSAFIFTTERGSPFTVSGFAKMLTKAGIVAGLGSSYAAPCLRLCAGEQGPRHTVTASLSRAQEHPAHRPLHGACS
jgi:integrase